MKYKVGDKLYYNNCSGEYIECTVVGLLEKTNRYRIQYVSSWDNHTNEMLLPEYKLFSSINDGIDSEIHDVKKQIEQLQSKLALLNQKKRKTPVIP